MYQRLWHEPYPGGVVFKWLLMAFIGGNINAGGFMACKRFVSHTTGFYTLFGIDAAATNWRLAISMLSVPVYFMIGVMIAAFFTDTALASGRHPRFGWVMGSVSGLLFLAALGGYLTAFGSFGATFHLEEDYPLIVVLAFASGLQNSAITTASGAALRCTHMTGITTDLGIGLVRTFFAKSKPNLRQRESYRNRLRAGTLIAFAAGSLVGAMLFALAQYAGFILPGILAAYVGNLGMRASQQPSGYQT